MAIHYHSPGHCATQQPRWHLLFPPKKKTGRTSGLKHPFSRVAAGALDLHYTTSLPLTRSASHGNPSPKQAQQ